MSERWSTEGSTTGQELFHLTATSQLRVYVQVPQVYASWISPGCYRGPDRFPERPDRRHPARVVSTAQSIDPTTRTLLTELEADNPKGELLPGSFAQVHLPMPAGMSSLAAALQHAAVSRRRAARGHCRCQQSRCT